MTCFPVIDNLEMALQHASNDVSSGLVQGVEITLKELREDTRKIRIDRDRGPRQAI